ADERDSFFVNYGSADLRHHDFRCGGFQPVNENGIVGMTRYEIVHTLAHVASGVRVLAEAKPCRIEVPNPKSDAGITGGAAGLMTVRAVVVQIRERAFTD